jgi:hypothetical protein
MKKEIKIDQKKVYYYSLVMLLGAVIYFLFPLVFHSTVLTMGLLVFINPIYNIVSSMLYTVKFGIHAYLPISLGLLCLPSMVLFYGLEFLYYGLFYTASSLIGCCFGYPIYKRYT